ncbi:MAG: 3-phosphoshikimate 1-carboxyvinyltransferase [Ilumatobacteraceae bacterium]
MATRRVTPLLHRIDAVVSVPGSKSIANRALVCAALADGTSTFTNLPDGDDTRAMLTCLEVLGIGVDRTDPQGATTTIRGTGGALTAGPLVLPTRLAGTTSRFITALAALGAGPYLIDGDPPLRARPMAPLHDALADLGVTLTAGDRWGHLPVTVSGPPRGGGPLQVRGDISSQFLTALMMIGPHIDGGLQITITSPLVSRPYLQITKAVMSDFGHEDVTIGDNDITVGPGRYRARDYAIEPDASSASYPFAAAAVCGGRIEVPGLTKGSMQGDAAFCEVLTKMGCNATRGEHSTIMESGDTLRGIDIDMVDMSDLVPTLAATAVFASTPTRIRGVGFIRAKESDRLGDLCLELGRLGALANETDDGLVIEPSALHGSVLQTHHDHRLAMAFGVIGLQVADVEIENTDVVSKSWPGFWEMLEGLR